MKKKTRSKRRGNGQSPGAQAAVGGQSGSIHPYFLISPRDFPPGFLPGAERTPPPVPSAEAMQRAEAYVDPSRLISARLFVPYNPSVLVTRKGLQVFDQMALDEQVKSSLQFKILAVLAGGWEIVSPEDQEDDWEVTTFVRDALTYFPGGWNAALEKILRALKYGYSCLEKVYVQRELGPLAGKLALDRLVEVKQHYIDFETDASGVVEAIVQMPAAGQNGEGRYSPTKFLHYVYQREHENPYGRSDLEAAYRAWWVKDNAYKWFAILLERFGIPPLFAMYDPSVYQGSQVEELKKVVRNIQAATMGLLPRPGKDTLEFFSQSLAAGSREIFTAGMARFDADISKALLQPSLIGFSQESGSLGPQSGGSLARSNISWRSFMMVVRYLQEDVAANAINAQVIPQMCDLNFSGLKSYPLFKFARLDEEKEVELFALWKDLVAGKIVNRIEDDERHIRKALGMPESDEITIEDLPGDVAAQAKADALKKGLDPEEEEPGKPKKVPDEEQTEEMRAFAEENGGEWVYLLGHPVCLAAGGWDESEHPRHPAGDEKGGEFAPAKTHLVTVIVRDESIARRGALRDVIKRVRVSASNDDEAKQKAENFYRRRGYKNVRATLIDRIQPPEESV